MNEQTSKIPAEKRRTPWIPDGEVDDMARTVSIGAQDFETVAEKDCFYIDKTYFIKEWWQSKDQVTLITRPRRFGKTLNLSMVERFFSNQYDDQEALFGDMAIWQDEAMRALAGQYPVISLSFADIKEETFEAARDQILLRLNLLFLDHEYLRDSPQLSAGDLRMFDQVQLDMKDTIAKTALKTLSRLLMKHTGKKAIILLDEYDTPMQEAYVNGYWDEIVSFTRGLFNAAFKTNPYLERALMTGITRVSRESLFSDLNNLEVSTITSVMYADSFGFTEQEVFEAMEEFDLDNQEDVKFWYDGFAFGEIQDIYNPWSITKFLKHRKFSPYWTNTSSNSLAGKLVQEGSANLKKDFETLLSGGTVTARIKEEVVYSDLMGNDDSVYSLLMATGYLKPVERNGRIYTLALTNYEVREMFEDLVRRWFQKADSEYNDFLKALLLGDLDWMNTFMNEIALQTFSSFDTGTNPSRSEPERFYHGFVLGLMVELKDRYHVRSNRESGFGRYDVILEPMDWHADDAIIIEFKVQTKKEPDLQETVAAALRQIEEKQYAQELIHRGFPADRIRSYGFAFEGKTVLIGEPETLAE